jgi:hypothetical protein
VPSAVSVPLAALFVFLAGFNVWIMLTERGASPRTRRLWARAHRIAGHTFIALFVVFCYFMLLRVRGASDELSPRIILHMSLALLLAPLLLAKVMTVRYQKDAWKVLMILGIGIFGAAFTLVALNVSVHYLRLAEKHKVAAATWAAIIAIAFALAMIGYFSGIRRLDAESHQAETRSPGVSKAGASPG